MTEQAKYFEITDEGSPGSVMINPGTDSDDYVKTFGPGAEALAQQIARAVNNHEKLLSAVEWAIAALEKSAPHKDTFSKAFYHRALADCRAALALAREG